MCTPHRALRRNLLPYAHNSIIYVTVSIKDFDKLTLEVKSFAGVLFYASETDQVMPLAALSQFLLRTSCQELP